MDSRMLVEVQGSFGQFYPALVTGFIEDNYINLIIGQCEDIKRSHLASTRLPAAMRQSPEIKVSPGDVVEAFTKFPTDLMAAASASGESELAAAVNSEVVFGEAWWPAKVREIKGTFAVVLLTVHLGTPNGTIVQHYPEIVELDKLRPVNTHPQLGAKSVYRFSIVLGSDDILDFCATTQQDLNKDLRERCGGPLLVSYNRETKSIEFHSLSERVMQKVEMLADTHERRIRDLFRIDEQTKRLFGMSLNVASHSNVIDEFVVAQSVLGAALQNLSKARKLEGITAIDVDKDSGRFRVAGENEQAVRDARNLLEFVEVTIGVPSIYAPRIIGRLGCNIQRIVDKSNVLRVNVLGEADRAASGEGGEDSKVPFRFMGSREAIDNARMMLEYRIETLRESDRLRASLAAGNPPSVTSGPLPSSTPPGNEPSSSTSGFNTGGSTASVNTIGRHPPRNPSAEREHNDTDSRGTSAPRNTPRNRAIAPISPHKRQPFSDVEGDFSNNAYPNAPFRRSNGSSSRPNTPSSSRSRNQVSSGYRSGNTRRNDYGEVNTRPRRSSAKPGNSRGDADWGGYDTDSAVQLSRPTFSLPRDAHSRDSLVTCAYVTDIDISADSTHQLHNAAAVDTCPNAVADASAKHTPPARTNGAARNGEREQQKPIASNEPDAVGNVDGNMNEALAQRRTGNGSNARRRRRPAPDANTVANGNGNGNERPVAAVGESK